MIHTHAVATTAIFVIFFSHVAESLSPTEELRLAVIRCKFVVSLFEEKYPSMQSSFDEVKAGLMNLNDWPMRDEDIALQQALMTEINERVSALPENPLDNIGGLEIFTLLGSFIELRTYLPPNNDDFAEMIASIGGVGELVSSVHGPFMRIIEVISC